MRPDKDRQETQSDPLSFLRSELVSAAHRRLAARRRRRFFVMALAVLALLPAASGALAITGSETGITAIDRWFDVADEVAPESSDEAGEHNPPKASFRPAPNTSSQPFDVPIASGSTVGLGYQSSDGNICTVLVENDDTSLSPPGQGACISQPILAEALAHNPARIVGDGAFPITESTPTIAIVQGFARGDVRNLALVMPDGEQMVAALSDAWTPGTWQGKPLRAFMVAIPLPPTHDATTFSPFNALLRATLRDGQVVDTDQ